MGQINDAQLGRAMGVAPALPWGSPYGGWQDRGHSIAPRQGGRQSMWGWEQPQPGALGTFVGTGQRQAGMSAVGQGSGLDQQG